MVTFDQLVQDNPRIAMIVASAPAALAIELLNEAGYRTPRGKPFAASSYYRLRLAVARSYSALGAYSTDCSHVNDKSGCPFGTTCPEYKPQVIQTAGYARYKRAVTIDVNKDHRLVRWVLRLVAGFRRKRKHPHQVRNEAIPTTWSRRRAD